MYGGTKPLPTHAWTEAKVKDLIRPNLEITYTAVLDQTRAVLYCGPAELGEGLTMEEAQASVENFSRLTEWAGQCIEWALSILILREGKEEEWLATTPLVSRWTRGEPKILQHDQVTRDSNLPGRLAMGIGRSPTQFQRDLHQQSVERRGRCASPFSSDASNWNTSNRADNWEKSHWRGMKHLRCHDHESTEPSTDEMEMGDEWSKSEQDDTNSTHHPGTWDGKREKVSLPNLNEKSTANDTWI